MASDYWMNLNRRRLSRRAVVRGGAVAGASAFALAIAGCSSSNNNTSGGNATANKAATSVAPPATPAAGAAAPSSTPLTTAGGAATRAAATTATASAGKRGGTIHLSKAQKDTGLDPQVTVTNPLHEAKAYSHTHTYRFSTDEVLFDVATAYEQTDPTTLTFKIRDGVTFQDTPPMNGRALTSEDIAYTFSRFPITLKNNASQVNQIQWGWMDSFQTPDKQTLVIKQKFPWASNLAAMGSISFGIVAKEAVEANSGNLGNVMNAGSGPYMMTKRDDTGTKYVRNAKYFQHTNPSPTYLVDGPYIDSWEERIIADGAAVKAAFLAGDLDLLDTSAVPVDKQLADELAKTSGVTVAKGPANTHLIMAFDNVKWTDMRLRQAVSLAIDRDAFIKTIYLGDGLYGGPVSAGFTTLAFTQDQLKRYEQYDPKKAKELWGAAGGPSAFPSIKMVTGQFIPLFAQATEFVADNLRRNLGVDVKIDSVDGATYVAKAVAPQKEWDLFIAYELSLLTIPDYNALTHYVPEGYGAIFCNLKHDSPKPEVAQLADQITRLNTAQASALTLADRKPAMDALQQFLLESFAPALPLPVQATAYGAYRTRVKNFPANDFMYPTSSASAIRVQDLWLEG